MSLKISRISGRLSLVSNVFNNDVDDNDGDYDDRPDDERRQCRRKE